MRLADFDEVRTLHTRLWQIDQIIHAYEAHAANRPVELRVGGGAGIILSNSAATAVAVESILTAERHEVIRRLNELGVDTSEEIETESHR